MKIALHFLGEAVQDELRVMRCPGKLTCTPYHEINIKQSIIVPKVDIPSTTGGLRWTFQMSWGDRSATAETIW